jgi:amino acid adenylation domain-containing protein
MSTQQVENIHRLSFLQEGLLFHSVEDPGAAFYVDQVTYRLTGRLDLGLFRRAWELIARRHAVLRTSFHWKSISELVQVVHANAMVPVQVLDWRQASPAVVAGELDAFLRADRRQGFDLERPPLIRVTLIRLTDLEHRFVFHYHHMLLDAWSGLMVLDEVLGCYDDLAADRAPEVTAAPSFHDYVSWVRNQDLAAAERYWRSALRGVTEPTFLPLIRPACASGPAQADDSPDNPEETIAVPAATVGRLRRVARERQVTLGALLHTCWALLLARYCGRDEVVFGVTMSSRPAELDRVAETAGLFISTLPVRVRLGPDETVAVACGRVQRQLSELRTYDFSPLAQIQQWSQLPAGAPLFETIMTILNVPGIDALQRREGAVTLSDGSYRYRTNYPLSLLVIPESDELSLRVGYDPGRVDGNDVVRLLRHLHTIVAAVAADPGLRVADVPVVADSERELLLSAWSNGPASNDNGRLAHQLIEDVADSAGEATAISHDESKLSYAELDRRANQLAHHLRSLGAGPETVLGLCLPRSVQQIVSMLAVLKAGGCFLPLDPEYPQARLAAMLAAARVTIVITDRERRARLPGPDGDGRTVLLDADQAQISAWPTGRPEPAGHRDNPAYVIYTSGSTGQPKGVMVQHRGLANLIQAQVRRFGLCPADRVLQWASPTFDASVFEVMLALGAGATLHVADAERVAPGSNLADLLRTERITALTITPSALAATAAEGLPDLRLLIVAGEAVPADLAHRWTSGRRMVNAYGPTETTVWATAADCVGGEVPPPIGTPVDNLVVRVLDETCRPVPAGVPGELYIGGVALARGYLGQPAQTAARFVPDPFSAAPGARLYRTGDMVSWRTDGQLAFLGRRDRQVKVRGFRVEITEVESALRSQDGIAECAVVAQSSDGTGPADTLAAYVVSDGDPPEPGALREGLERLLPSWMVPTVFTPLDRLPLTASGKLDEKALQAVTGTAAGARRGLPRRPPQTMAEQAVAMLWADVLKADEIGLDDDFFELRGNSIKATQVVARVRRSWQVELPLRTVFEARTVEQFALLLERALAEQLSGDPGTDGPAATPSAGNSDVGDEQ